MPEVGIKRELSNHGGLTNQAEIPTWLEKATTGNCQSLENMWEKYDACLLCSHSSLIHLVSWTRCWARLMCSLAQSDHSNFTNPPHA